MILKWIIKCDRCGYIINGLQEEFAQDIGGQDLCEECLKEELEGK